MRRLFGALIISAALIGAARAQDGLDMLNETEPGPPAGADALYELLTSAEDASLEDVRAMLEEAYAQYPTSSSRARAFTAAAETAARDGEFELAFAWLDWALETAGGAFTAHGDIEAETLESAIAIAIEAEHPLNARDYVRRQAALENGWTHEPANHRIVFEDLNAACPDVIAERFLRTRIVRDAIGPAAGTGAPSPGRCRYVDFVEREPVALELYAARSYQGSRARIRGVAEVGLDPADRAVREEIARRLPRQDVLARQLPTEIGEADLGYVRYRRPGADEVEAIAYLTYGREGTYYAARASMVTREWPPEALSETAELGLTALAGDVD